MKSIFCPAAGGGIADRTPLAVAANGFALPAADDLLLHKAGKLAKGDFLAIMQATGSQHGAIVPGHSRAFAHTVFVVRAGRANLVYTYGKLHWVIGAEIAQHLAHMLLESAAVALTHKISGAKPVVGAQRQPLALSPHICAGVQ